MHKVATTTEQIPQEQVSDNPIRKTLYEVLAFHLGLDSLQIKPTQRLSQDLEADPLDCVEVLVDVEEKLGITISDELLDLEFSDEHPTVNDLEELILQGIK